MSPLNINGWASCKMWVTVATFSLSQSYMQTQNTERKSQNFFSLQAIIQAYNPIFGLSINSNLPWDM
mgnify:CR=1 FL=1